MKAIERIREYRQSHGTAYTLRRLGQKAAQQLLGTYDRRYLRERASEEELRARIGETGQILSARCASAVQGDWLLVTLSAECEEQIGEVVPITLRESNGPSEPFSND